jgi:hypothetical protein
MNPDSKVVGLQPWLPWPFHDWDWWCLPVRAERLAALRVGLATVMLLDLLLTYLPDLPFLFGPDSSCPPKFLAWRWEAPRWHWSLLRWFNDSHSIATHPAWLTVAAWTWAVASFTLLIGFFTRTSAVLCWLLNTSFANLNPYIDNAGDDVRGIVLFYLMLCPCGAAWSIDRLRGAFAPAATRVLVHPWPLRLLFLQMICIYFLNGVYKLTGQAWIRGESLYYVLGDVTLARWSYAQFPVPFWLTRALTYAVLAWEVGFPFLVALPWVWIPTLWFGVAFHLGIFASMEIGGFAPYMLCLYLPLLPWEHWADRRHARRVATPPLTPHPASESSIPTPPGLPEAIADSHTSSRTHLVDRIEETSAGNSDTTRRKTAEETTE